MGDGVFSTRACGQVMFSVMSVCLSVCPSVQAITFEPLSHRNFIFDMQIHLYHI